MKQGPEFKRIEDNMRSGQLAAHQFLGTDTRSLKDIIRHDQLVLEPLGITNQDIANRMRYFTEKAAGGLGLQVVDDVFEVEREEHKGDIPCPFADNVQASKSITRVKNLRTGRTNMVFLKDMAHLSELIRLSLWKYWKSKLQSKSRMRWY